MPIERETIRAALTRKGFREKSAGHIQLYLFVDGKKTSVFTRLSHGSGHREYSDDLVGMVARQIGLTKGEFVEFVDCRLEFVPYVGLLRQRSRIR
jgi:hypothetical protein